jgi:uncharacterized protein (DUF1684 family)
MPSDEYLELTDWRRRVAELFATWRAAAAIDPVSATLAFRAGKDELFQGHAQSPLPPGERGAFEGLAYWPYDTTYRMTVRLEPAPDVRGPHEEAAPGPLGLRSIELPSSGPGAIAFRRVGRVQFTGPLEGHSLSVFWIEGYGGGLFVPFRDATSGTETYGAGRYALDTVKGADHGGDPGEDILVIDFNMAHHPSCAYDPRWSCPLAPPENTLPVAVPAGERLSSAH